MDEKREWRQCVMSEQIPKIRRDEEKRSREKNRTGRQKISVERMNITVLMKITGGYLTTGL